MPAKSQRFSSSQLNTSSLDFNDDDYDKFSADAVFFVLVQERKRIPVKKADIMKHINLTGKAKGVQDRVMTDCTDKLHHVFGIEMVENTDKKGVYYLVNKIKEEPQDPSMQHLTWSDKENAHLGLLYTVLGLIFMSPSNVVREDVLFKFLRLLGVYEEDERAGGSRGRKSTGGSGAGNSNLSAGIRGMFGNVRELIFDQWGKKMHYIDIDKIDSPDTDNVVHEFRWGFRAEQELNKEDVLEVISQMYECPPTAFKEQYDKVQEQKKRGGGGEEQEDEPMQGTSS